MRHRICCLTFLFSGLIGTGVFATSYVSGEFDSSWLGRGIHSQSGALKQACVRGTWQEHANHQLTLGFQNKQDVSDSLKEVSGKISGDINLGLFSAGASVSVHSRMVESANSVSVVFRLHYKGHSVSLAEPTMTETGLDLVGKPREEIVSSCGDEYIDRVHFGNDIYVVSQLVFKDRAEYRKFQTKIRTRVLFFKIESTRTDEFYEYTKNARYSIKVLSQGKVPEFIAERLQGSDEIHCSSDSEESMLSCDQAGEEIINYLVDDNGYAKWLGETANLSPLYYQSSPYARAGFAELDNILNPLSSAWKQLNSRLMDLIVQQRVLLNVYQSYTEVPQNVEDRDFETRSKIQTNIGWLELAQTSCAEAYLAENIAACEEAISFAKERLHRI